jgi:hypothetical protein
MMNRVSKGAYDILELEKYQVDEAVDGLIAW